jgi:hypothetical protein
MPRSTAQDPLVSQVRSPSGRRAARGGKGARLSLRWISTDPHTVALVFRPGTAAEITWLIGRDLLAAGVHGPAGLGDVSILPDLRSGAHRELVLSSPSGRRGFRFPVAAVVAFLDRTRAAEGGAR